MHFKPAVVAALSALLVSPAFAAPKEILERRATLNDFVKQEDGAALKGVLANIGTGGAKASGAAPGVVIASPSRKDPPYFYSWTRDAALTMKAVTERFIETKDATLEPIIQQYISAQAGIQQISNPSGVLSDGSGLAEPKYEVNKTAFTGAWGRPQRDGPGLRATALITYGNYLIANGKKDLATNIVWPIVSNDLAYVGQYWNQTGFDLWEEVQGSSFFTIGAQYRSLIEGSAFAKAVGKSCPNCDTVAPQILCFFSSSFWNGKGIVSNINVNNGRAGLDVNSILTSIHMFDPTAACDDSTFQPCSARALANHKTTTDSFRSWPINKGVAQGKAVNIGRYIEDVYMNGNPWYLATLAAAEQLYDALYQWEKLGKLSITDVSLAFFKDLYPSAAKGDYASTTPEYAAITKAVKAYAEEYMGLVQKYTPADGALAEQYGKADGKPLSAVDLTWSYAAFLTAAARREGAVPATWGEPKNNVSPSQCTGTTAQGTYKAAKNTAWDGSTPPDGGCEKADVVQVTFTVDVVTQLGESVGLVGSIPQLGNWSPSSAVNMKATKSGSAVSPTSWSATVPLGAALPFEYKFVRKSSDGKVIWEKDPNRSFTVPSPQKCDGSDDTANVKATWQQ